MKQLLILSIFILLASCKTDRCTMGYYEDWQTYYIVDTIYDGGTYKLDTFKIEAVHTYSRGKVKTKLKAIKLN